MIAMAIMVSLFGFGLFMSFEAYRGYNSHSERDVVVSVLQKARSRAVSNYYQTTWGVCYSVSQYIIFRGSVCTPGASTNETIPASANASVSGLSSGIVFSQLSGTTVGSSVTIVQGGRTETITINNEGLINW